VANAGSTFFGMQLEEFTLGLACKFDNASGPTALLIMPPPNQIRFFNGVFQHSIRPRPIPLPSSSDEAFPLFLPVITSTCSPILECDFNIHKSNSTYFSDLDVSRTHLVSLLCSPGLADYHKRLAAGEENGPLGIALGGVACFFQREIKPYERYEMWTRVLCWDRKWVYIVTHFVKKGAVAPTTFVMQPNKRGWWPSWMNTKKAQAKTSLGPDQDSSMAGKKVIFSYAISKYVFKSGRKTMPPETVFEQCGLLPPRPIDSTPESSSTEDSGLVERTMVEGGAVSPDSMDELLDLSLLPSQADAKAWTWEMVEKERQRGMEIGELMAGMDRLKEEFTGDSKPALGAYRDLLWT
jgi:hypothetical protein